MHASSDLERRAFWLKLESLSFEQTKSFSLLYNNTKWNLNLAYVTCNKVGWFIAQGLSTLSQTAAPTTQISRPWAKCVCPKSGPVLMPTVCPLLNVQWAQSYQIVAFLFMWLLQGATQSITHVHLLNQQWTCSSAVCGPVLLLRVFCLFYVY